MGYINNGKGYRGLYMCRTQNRCEGRGNPTNCSLLYRAEKTIRGNSGTVCCISQNGGLLQCMMG